MPRRTMYKQRAVALARTRTRARAFAAVFALAALLFALAASPAFADKEQKEFEVFNGCPVENTEVTGCITAVTTEGEFKIGSKTVPLTAPVILPGGGNGSK